MSVVTMRKLLEAGVHFGHQTRRWDPKMKPYIYAAKNNVYIIDLEKTQEHLDTAYNAMKAIAERGGKVLFVGTKRQAQTVVLEESLRSGSFYVNQRWLGGILTNYRTIQKSIKQLVEIEQMEETGAINNYSKKEAALIRKKAGRLENFLGGIKEMKKLPDAVFVVEPKEEHNAVAEARKLKIPVFGICDTNCDPAIVDYPIPGNDDAVRSIKLIISLMADAIVESKGGLLSVAYTEDDAPEVTMADVIINVDEQNAENERRRRARVEERRQRQNQRDFRKNTSYRPRNNYEDRNNAATTEPVAKEAVKVEKAVETPVSEVVEKPVAEVVEAKVAEASVETAPKKTKAIKEVEDTPVAEEKVEVAEEKVKKPKAKKEVEDTPVVEEKVEVTEEKVKKPRAKKVAVETAVVEEETVAEEKKARKPRAKKVVEETTEEK